MCPVTKRTIISESDYFLLISILEADLRYNNNINIVYNDTDDVVTNRR